MLSIVRGIALALVAAGFFAAVHPQATSKTTSATSSSSAKIPVPVCPPNDPNACHIDE